MKYTVNVGGKLFEVEIADLDARPILARVDGETIEVWPEGEGGQLPTRVEVPADVRPLQPAGRADDFAKNGSARLVRAPLPGTVISLLVKPGAEVSIGQELLVLEAMKMKNTLRASQAGRVAAVHVTTGQTVKHHDVLIEYAD